ncbi:MAG TPA: hypothetical protein VKG45_03105 [Actinomycetes bacterium]|nr:hypothetical protein [Actinomycetes bacterium]
MTASAYSFLSWLRRGIASRITQPPGAAARASVTVSLRAEGTAVAGGGTLTQPIQHDVALYGPGDVVGVDPRAIVRTDPRDQITNFDPNFLPFIEFYEEDFPWRYSPDVVDPATGRLRPWLALVVLTDDEFTDKGTLPGRPLPFVEVGNLATLPPPDQTGAWAHVHANRTVTASATETVSNDMAAVLPRLAAVLAENPDLACSRVMCPRRLDPESGYHAFLVPAFETGRLAGLGLDPAGSPGALQSSWVDYPDRPESASLCYYRRWQFRTAPVGDFEYLVRLLKPRTVDARVGNRDMDVRQPGAGLPGITTDPQLGGVLRLGGALKVPDTALDPDELAERQRFENWDQPYPHPFQQALAALVDLGDDYMGQTAQAAHQRLAAVAASFAASQAVTPADPDPLVTPPLYGRWHALTSRLLTERDGTPVTPNDNWVHELNLDPRFRVPAGTGGRVVRGHEEEFMQAAWDQLGDVLEANKRIRAAQFAREVAFVHHANHLEPLRVAASGLMLAVSAPLQARVVPAQAGLAAAAAAPATLAASFADSVVAATPLSPVMRRVTRPGSKLMRNLPFGPGPGSDLTAGAAGAADAAGGGPPPGRQELLERMNAGEVTAAPPKVAPPAVVTVDALEQVLAGPIIEIPKVTGGERLLLPDPVPNPVPDLPTSSDFVVSLPGDGVHPHGGGADSAEAVKFKQALNEAYGAFNSAFHAGEVPPRTSVDLPAAADATLEGLHPDLTVPRRALGGIALPERLLPADGDGGGDGPIEPPHVGLRALALQQPDTLGEVMAYPVIDLPTFRPLVDLSPELFCPNVNLVPPNSITLLETNPRFIESYLVGLNHEMARELLWREYPTDQRGSVFRQFWDVRSVLPLPGETAQARSERLRDIPPIHTWDKASKLGQHNNRGPSVEDLVLVIRGELLKKYPTAVIYAHRADWRRHPDGSIDPTQERRLVALTPAEEADPPHAKVRMPLFDAKVEPDIYFFGFDLTEEQARGGTGANPNDDPGWFFVIKERPGDPRFGLDIERDGLLEVWNDLAWPDVLPATNGAQPGYIRFDANTPTLVLTPPTDPADVEKADQYAEDKALTWNAQLNAADVAYILYQAPVLVAVHAREMLGDG